MVSLVVVVVVVMGASKTEAAAVVRREERLAADELAPHTDQNGTDDHADDRYAHASNDADQDGQENVRGKLAEE